MNLNEARPGDTIVHRDGETRLTVRGRTSFGIDLDGIVSTMTVRDLECFGFTHAERPVRKLKQGDMFFWWDDLRIVVEDMVIDKFGRQRSDGLSYYDDADNRKVNKFRWAKAVEDEEAIG